MVAPVPVQLWASEDKKLHETQEAAQAHNDFLRVVREFSPTQAERAVFDYAYEAFIQVFVRYPLPPDTLKA